LKKKRTKSEYRSRQTRDRNDLATEVTENTEIQGPNIEMTETEKM
jgi:hypothetical protein